MGEEEDYLLADLLIQGNLRASIENLIRLEEVEVAARLEINSNPSDRSPH